VAPGFLSPWHLVILALVVLLVFGPSRLPEMERALGRGMREFKESVSAAPQDDDPAPLERDRETVG
jgi:sec-independent protein translocase protein TatA